MKFFERSLRFRIGHCIAAGLLLTAGGAAAQSAKPVPPASEVYKNLKVLGATPSDSLNQGMHLISGELGVDCEYCHADHMRWELDEKKTKDTARDMMTMMMEINRRYFKGERVVTCYTCHQGKPIPVSTVALPIGDYFKEPGPAPALPAPEQLISKYIAAIGGEQNIRKITTRVITATQDLPTGPGGSIPSPGTVEIFEKAPNLVLRIAKTKDITQLSGADSKGPWVQDGRGRVNAPAIDVERVRETRNADFYDALDILKEYPMLKTEGIEKVNGADAYVVLGEATEGLPMRMYFDVKTGLLVRRRTETPTHSGMSPFQVDYLDYRDAGHGVKYPYRIHNEPAGPRTEIVTHSTIRISKIQENVALDDAKFNRPPSVDRGGKKKQ
jgi:photosynthetic reaction center cytochrome c subunit